MEVLYMANQPEGLPERFRFLPRAVNQQNKVDCITHSCLHDPDPVLLLS